MQKEHLLLHPPRRLAFLRAGPLREQLPLDIVPYQRMGAGYVAERAILNTSRLDAGMRLLI
jgi:hypothetical protein